MEVYGLVGDPVTHSASPGMFAAAFEATGRDATYVTFRVPADGLATAIEGASALGLAGLNVTVPHKEAILAHVDPDDLAADIGAVNTVDFEADGFPETRPTGHNTDAEGARRALTEDGGLDLERAHIVVVGAGGAGRAIAHGCAAAGASVHVANRTHTRAETLAAEIESATAGPLAAVGDVLAEPDVDALVNATSVGMEADESPVDPTDLHADLLVMDAVYSPRETRLLRDAAQAGARTVDGTRMLLYQGAAAFELWTGDAAPLDAMERGLEAALAAGRD